METMEIKLKTLTPIWTGGVEIGTMDRLHETGIIGSLRWWYEAIVRGLGGSACDPTDGNSCPDKNGKRCTACELFGCTSWQRKFKLFILNENRSIFKATSDKDGLIKNTSMIWQFIQLRPIHNEEKWLLYQAVHVAAEYGAIGGRTPRKPQGNKTVGGDCGLFDIQGKSGIPQGISKESVMAWLKTGGFRKVGPKEKWPDMRWFFFVQKQYLRRKKINELLGLSEDGKKPISHDDFQKALRGQIGVSKKIFSFETPPEIFTYTSKNNAGVSKKIFSFETPPGRIWGYLPNQDLLEKTINYLHEKLGIKAENIKTGEDVLNEL